MTLVTSCGAQPPGGLGARGVDGGSVTASKRAGKPSDKIVTFDRQEAALSGNDSDGERPGGDNNEDGANLDGVNVPLTAAQKKEKKRIQKKSPSASGNTNKFGTSHHHRDRTTDQLAKLAKPSNYKKFPQSSKCCVSSGVTIMKYLI